ncbi:MAG: nucleotidyltransferase domain-containing protein [Nitrospirae bacterium]|nr:nucleotidyltransferase domain-containing protein [Nitrospirota bacterium]
MQTVKKIKEISQEAINRHGALKEHLITLYLFGSVVKGTEKEKSDIDIAFVFEDAFYKADPFIALQEAELSAVEIGIKAARAVDVTVLNGASLIFTYYVIKEGLCIYERSTAERIIYEVTLDNKYQDFMPFIKELRETKRRALLGRD